MTVAKYERLNSFKTTVNWISGSTYYDPSGNLSYLDVIRPDNTYLIQQESGIRDSTGIYYYYISTQSTDPLGLYRIRWYGYFNFEGPWQYMPKYDTEVVHIVDVNQND